MLFMGLYCFRGSILYRWRSVMSTARFSDLWKWLIWETQSSSLVTPRDTVGAHKHSDIYTPCREMLWAISSWVYVFVHTTRVVSVCTCGKVMDICSENLLPCVRCRRTGLSWICLSAADHLRPVWTMLPCQGCLASVRHTHHKKLIKIFQFNSN